MDYLWLSESHAKTLVAFAANDAPNETCGLIMGLRNKAERIVPIRNVAGDPQHFFQLDPTEMARVLPELHTSNLEILAFYHSHPHGKPIPSQADIQNADYGSVHLIIGLEPPQAEIAVWEINNLRVARIDLHIGLSQPVRNDSGLTRAQHYAILISTLLAFIILIIISLSLLPPAPPIP